MAAVPKTGYGAPIPPAGGTRWWKIYRTQGVSKNLVLILSDWIYGQWFHWHGNDNLPCTMRQGCPMCERAAPNRWSGYVAALVGAKREEAVWTIPHYAAAKLQVEYERRGTLRGIELHFFRSHDRDEKRYRKNAKIDIEIIKSYPGEQIKPAFPVEYSLHRFFGVLDAKRNNLDPGRPWKYKPDEVPGYAVGNEPIPY